MKKEDTEIDRQLEAAMREYLSDDLKEEETLPALHLIEFLIGVKIKECFYYEN